MAVIQCILLELRESPISKASHKLLYHNIYIVYGYKRDKAVNEIDAVDYGEIFLQTSYEGFLFHPGPGLG